MGDASTNRADVIIATMQTATRLLELKQALVPEQLRSNNLPIERQWIIIFHSIIERTQKAFDGEQSSL